MYTASLQWRIQWFPKALSLRYYQVRVEGTQRWCSKPSGVFEWLLICLKWLKGVQLHDKLSSAIYHPPHLHILFWCEMLHLPCIMYGLNTIIITLYFSYWILGNAIPFPVTWLHGVVLWGYTCIFVTMWKKKRNSKLLLGFLLSLLLEELLYTPWPAVRWQIKFRKICSSR